ncbi:hypothetical protein OS493_030050 [Desmophyllum pertusum]|uniref:SCP domain-containing protein n=1 Tax=Desmophyllum pertusum TaxID=174260 RepID=A0A9W9ZA36_9CNID|nr:hypothetical protein OS493_030050 [Desmophyllum pertusum]
MRRRSGGLVWRSVRLSVREPPNSIFDVSGAHWIGHFTQVVWKATTHVGVGLKKIVNSDGKTETYVVARYSPPGNVNGQLGDNVGAKTY